MQQQKYRHVEYRYTIFSPFLATKYANILHKYNITMYTPQLKDVQQENEVEHALPNRSLHFFMQENKPTTTAKILPKI